MLDQLTHTPEEVTVTFKELVEREFGPGALGANAVPNVLRIDAGGNGDDDPVTYPDLDPDKRDPDDDGDVPPVVTGG